MDHVRDFGKIARGLARNPLGIIALFIVLVYGIAAFITASAGSLTPGERLPLVYFLVVFPILVLGVFAWLVSKHSGKLFAPGDFKDEANYVKLQATRLSHHIEELKQAALAEPDLDELRRRIDELPRISVGPKPPEDPKENDLWIDTSPREREE
jgi:hypothetical protein